MSEETEEKTKVLLADDHHVVRQGIRRLLEREADIDVVGEAEDGQEALRLSRELKPDVLVIEARMPKLDTVEVIRQVKAEQAASVLVLTNYDDEELIDRLLTAGANGYLLKTARGHDLVRAIWVVCGGEFIFDPVVQKKLLKHASSPHQVMLDFGEHLTRREAEVMKMVAKGMSNRDIAGYLGLAERTVKGYLMSIFSKLGVGSRTEAVHEALKRGWIILED
jgi:DNA-binding NarL/FixJ family response regulator